MVADDQGHPPRFSTATVTVRVRRDEFPPQFDSSGSYDRTINVGMALSGTTALVVHCSDQDLQVTQCAILFF